MSIKSQITPDKGLLLPIHHPTTTGSPAVTSITANSVIVSWYPMPVICSTLAKLAVPQSGENPAELVLRHNTLYLSQLLLSRGLFEPVTVKAGTPPSAGSGAAQPAPTPIVHSTLQTGGVVPTPAPTPTTPANAKYAGLPMYHLLQHVQATGNLNGVASLFLTLWNDAALRKDKDQTTLALQLWNKAVSDGPASDVGTILFYDPATKQMIQLPSSALPKLAGNAAIAARWAAGETFRKELSPLAIKVFDNFFSAPQPAAAKSQANFIRPMGEIRPMAQPEDSWLFAGSTYVALVSCGAVVWTGGVAAVITPAGALCVGTGMIAVGSAIAVYHDYFPPASESLSTPMSAIDVPACIPIQSPDGTMGYLQGPVEIPSPDPGTPGQITPVDPNSPPSEGTMTPVDPTQPDNPVQSTDPTQTDNPTQTLNPVETGNPSQTDNPTDNPTQPDNPTQTSDPTDNPTQTDNPIQSNNPTDNPNQTDNPTPSGTDDQSSTPPASSPPDSSSSSSSPDGPGGGGPADLSGTMKDEARFGKRRPPIHYETVTQPKLPERKPGKP